MRKSKTKSPSATKLTQNRDELHAAGDLLAEQLSVWKQAEASQAETLHSNTHARIRNVIRAEQGESLDAAPFTSGLRTLWIRVAYLAGIPALGLLLVMGLAGSGKPATWSGSVPDVAVSKDDGEIVFQGSRSIKIYKSNDARDFSGSQELEGGAGHFRDAVDGSENLVFYRIE